MDNSIVQQEMEVLRPLLDKAQYGAFLILPLKYDEFPNMDYIRRISRQEDPDTVDLSAPVKAMLSGSDPAAVGSRHRMTGEEFVRELLGQENARRAHSFFVENESGRYGFAIHSADLYLFHTKVAFLSLGLTEFSGYDSLPTGTLSSNVGALEVYAHPDQPDLILVSTQWYTATKEEGGQTLHTGFNVYIRYDCPLA